MMTRTASLFIPLLLLLLTVNVGNVGAQHLHATTRNVTLVSPSGGEATAQFRIGGGNHPTVSQVEPLANFSLFVDLTVRSLRCRWLPGDRSRTNLAEKSREFYVLYVKFQTVAEPVRIASFNTGCDSQEFHSGYCCMSPTFVSDPPPDPTADLPWFEDNIEVEIWVERSEDASGVEDPFRQLVLSGEDIIH